MPALLQDLNEAITIAFALLALATLADWVRHRDRQRLFLVVALVSLALLALVAPMAAILHFGDRVTVDVSIVLFLLSGYALLMFRDALLPLGTRTRVVTSVAVIVVALLGLAAGLSSDPQASHSVFQLAVTILLVVAWVLCITEPMLRFAFLSVRRPAVEGARLRALSLGYAGLVLVVLIGTAGGAVTRNTVVAIASDIVVLAAVPLLYASFAPPIWLRRIWSRPEEEQVRAAMHDLLLYNPNRETLARRAIEWATRLVGAQSAFIVDSDGAVLAVHGLSEADAKRDAAHPMAGTFVIPLDLESGKGAMTIVAGAVAPVFGEWELSRLRAYAVSVTAGLDRVSLTSRVAALEKAKTEFLNIASHELRGPMTVIKGYLTMIAAGSLGDIPSRTQAVLPLLIAKADEVNSLLEQMIEASRLEDGRMALKKERCDIAELAEAAIENLEPLLSDHELNVEIPTRPVWADVDPDRFQIVVRNLVSNAVKYSASGTRVLVNVHSNRHNAILAVSDEGIGIADDDQPRLFTRFGRVENRATAGTPGTGLGLWLSREIARMHDGDLTVESEPGKGSTFTFEIPLDRG